LDIRLTKGEMQDFIDIRRSDGSTARTTFPKKGPVPHDAVHLFVERELGISDGFWGLVARGSDPDELAGMAKAAGNPSASRAETPQPHVVPIVQAERIVECFEADLWSGGSDNSTLRDMARAGCEQSLVPEMQMSDEAIDRVRAEVADFARRWTELKTGDSLTLEWPEATSN
jgi:hypothetical protein